MRNYETNEGNVQKLMIFGTGTWHVGMTVLRWM